MSHATAYHTNYNQKQDKQVMRRDNIKTCNQFIDLLPRIWGKGTVITKTTVRLAETRRPRRVKLDSFGKACP